MMECAKHVRNYCLVDSIKGVCVLAMALFFWNVQVFAQCITPPNLSFEQCQNAPLSFDSFDSTLTNVSWYINKLELDSFSSRVNMGDLGSTLGTFSGVTLIKQDSNWFGFYNNLTPNAFYRLDFGRSLDNIPIVVPLTVTNIASATNLRDGSLDFIEYNGEWVAFTCTRTPASIVRYRFGSSLTADTINADLITTLFGQFSAPYDVEVVKSDSNYFLLVVGTNNRFVRYNLGTNPLINTPSSFQTITTTSLSPPISDPRSVVSKTICDTTVVFINGRLSNSINRLIFNDLSLAPMSVEGVATGETWVGPYSLLVDIQDAQPRLYVQQWNSSPAFGKIFSLNTNSLLSAGAASWSRSELNIPGGLFTTSFALAHDSAKSYVFQARYSPVGLFKSTSLNNPPKSQRAFYYQPTFDLNQLDTGLNMVTGEFYSADGQLIIVYDTINVRAAPNDQIQVLDHCFSGSTPISVVDQNGVADSRFWDFGNGDTLTSLADTVVTTYPAPNAYTITVTSANASCVSIDSFPIVIHHVPISNFSADTACAGEVVNIVNSSTIGGGDSITQWLWIFNGTDSLFGENPNFTTNQSGNLSISLISYSSAGCTDTATDSTFIKPIPSANFTLEQTCFGDSTYFYSTVPQNGGYTILWDFGDGQTAVDSSPAHLYLNAGLYAASLTVTAVNGCEIESSTPILISPTPSIDYAIPSNICQNETIELQSSITSIDSIRSVAWTVLDSTYFGQSTSILPQSFGAELCTLEVIVGTDCRVDSVFTITINQAPIASFFLNDSCLNSLKIAEDNSFIPPTQTMVFNQWTFNGTSASHQDSFLLEPQTDSVYLMEYVVTTDSNCTSVLSRPIEIVGTPSLSVDFLEPLCTDLKLKFDLDTTSGATDQVSRIIWSVVEAQVVLDSVESFSPELILPDDSQYEIWAELQTVKGCKAFDRDTISPSLSPRLNIQNDSICQFTELHLSSNYSGSNY